jgi:hypothetical protein
MLDMIALIIQIYITMYQNTYGIQPEEGVYVDARDNFDRNYYVAQIVKVLEDRTKVEVAILNSKGKSMTV